MDQTLAEIVETGSGCHGREHPYLIAQMLWGAGSSSFDLKA
jgi:hypothetical protein